MLTRRSMGTEWTASIRWLIGSSALSTEAIRTRKCRQRTMWVKSRIFRRVDSRSGVRSHKVDRSPRWAMMLSSMAAIALSSKIWITSIRKVDRIIIRWRSWSGSSSIDTGQTMCNASTNTLRVKATRTRQRMMFPLRWGSMNRSELSCSRCKNSAIGI